MGKDSQENTCLSTGPSTAHLHTEGNKRFADKSYPAFWFGNVKNQALWKEGGGTAALRSLKLHTGYSHHRQNRMQICLF